MRNKYKINQVVIYQIADKKRKGIITDFGKDFFNREMYRIEDYNSKFELSIREKEIIDICNNNIKKL